MTKPCAPKMSKRVSVFLETVANKKPALKLKIFKS
uniref:Uncharacterized protein n=1 Tax=Anguilla anguilla TaxID=7936 RepID=A0A0E9QHT6_ANGAN